MRPGPVLDSLLRSREPSIRWKARVGILGEDRGSPAVRALREEVRRSPRVRALLSRRAELGRPGAVPSVYRKWQGTHWVLASLADLGYPEGDERLAPLRDRVLDLWLRPSYFVEYVAKDRAGTRRVGVARIRGRYRAHASQQGNALRALTRLGLLNARAEGLVERLLHWQWPDGGWNCDTRPGADSSSFMETLTPMRGLAAYAKQHGSAEAARAAERAAEVFLRRRLFRRIRDGAIIHPEFVQLHYPLYYHYDLLGGLTAMVELGKVRDPRCAEALDRLEEKQRAGGGWSIERRYYRTVGRSRQGGAEYVDWGRTDAERWNEWVTVDALSVLVAAGRFSVRSGGTGADPGVRNGRGARARELR